MIFTGQVPSALIGNDAFQEVDIVGITRPCTKHNYLVKKTEDLERIIKEAFYIAREGRPGPVLIDICKDVQNATGMFRYDMEVDLPGFEPWPTVSDSKVAEAAELLNGAERPLILAGHGIKIAGVSAELLELIEKAEIPVVTTLLGTGDIHAIYENGVFRPLGRVDLPNRSRIRSATGWCACPRCRLGQDIRDFDRVIRYGCR